MIKRSWTGINCLWVPSWLSRSRGSSLHQSDGVGPRSAPSARFATHWFDRHKATCSISASVLSGLSLRLRSFGVSLRAVRSRREGAQSKASAPMSACSERERQATGTGYLAEHVGSRGSPKVRFPSRLPMLGVAQTQRQQVFYDGYVSLFGHH